MLDEVRLRLDHAHDQHLVRGQLHLLEQCPFVRMTRIGGLDRNCARPGAKDDVDHIAERHVAMMRAFVIAPAQMHAQFLGRDVGQRVIHRLDVELRLPAPFGEAQVRMLDVPPHAEVGTVDLQHDPGVGDGLVLVPHRVGDGEKIRFFACVVLVAKEERDDTGRGCRHEHLFRLHLGERRLQVVDVRLRSGGIADADRRVARRRLPPRASRVAEHTLREVGKSDEILVDERIAGAAETAQSILDVGRIARLAHFAVVDDVDTRVGLLPHDFFDRQRDTLRERGGVDQNTLLLGVHHPDEIVRPREASRVRRQKSVGAALHEFPLDIGIGGRANPWILPGARVGCPCRPPVSAAHIVSRTGLSNPERLRSRALERQLRAAMLRHRHECEERDATPLEARLGRDAARR